MVTDRDGERRGWSQLEGSLPRGQQSHPGPIRVLLAEQHPIYRMGIRRAFAIQSGFSIVAETSSALDATALAASLGPDVIVLATDLPEKDGLALVPMLRATASRPSVVLLSEQPTDEQLIEAVRVGAAELLPRQVASDTLVDTVRRVSRGENPIDERVLAHPSVADRVLRLFGELQRASVPRVANSVPLSQRELEVLACMARGKSNKEIGRILTISDQTVKNHISSVLRKLAVSDRTQAVVIGVRRGWVDLTEGPGSSSRSSSRRRRPIKALRRDVWTDSLESSRHLSPSLAMREEPACPA